MERWVQFCPPEVRTKAVHYPFICSSLVLKVSPIFCNTRKECSSSVDAKLLTEPFLCLTFSSLMIASFFFKANSDECEHLKERLLMYKLSSGQKINLNKSKMIFSRNTLRDLRTQLANFVGVSKSDDLGVYLGLTSFVGRNRKEVFSYIKDRIWHRLNSWKRRFLSRAGKEVLLKSIVLALPAYTMNLFLLPREFCSDIEKTMNRFWWNSNKDNRIGIRCKRWELNFCRIHDFNLALLGK